MTVELSKDQVMALIILIGDQRIALVDENQVVPLKTALDTLKLTLKECFDEI